MKHHLTRKQRERQTAAVNKESIANGETVRPPSYIRRNGLPFGLMLGGLVYFLSPYFWLFVCLFLLGATLFVIDMERSRSPKTK